MRNGLINVIIHIITFRYIIRIRIVTGFQCEVKNLKLELFIMQGCPYCQRVLRNIAKSGRTDIELHDINMSREDNARLIEVGGMRQVPCLFIDGRPMYESLDIIDWLESHPQEG